MLLLAWGHIVVMTLCLGICSTGLVTLATRVDIAGWRRRIDALGGALLVAMGIRSAAAR